MNFKGVKHGILPAALLALSAGQVYAFTNFAGRLQEILNCAQWQVQFAFSLAIFFLGMGAAFFGPLVEKDVKRSALLGGSLLCLGLMISASSVVMKSSLLLWLGYGFLLGLGTGIIYVSPVKTMMLWYKEHRTLAAAVPVVFFGLGSTVSTMIYQGLLISLPLTTALFIFSIIYACMCSLGAWLLQKPEGAEEKLVEPERPEPGIVNYDSTVRDGKFQYSLLFRQAHFWCCWSFMLINISAGLCMIPLARQLVSGVYSASIVTLFIALAGLFNGAGRLVFAWAAGKMQTKAGILRYVTLLSVISAVCALSCQKLIGPAFLIINACYGAGFSVMPGILAEEFTMRNISKIHGAVLSAWGFAGLIGNSLAVLIGTVLGFGTHGVLLLVLGLYAVCFIIHCCLLYQAGGDGFEWSIGWWITEFCTDWIFPAYKLKKLLFPSKRFNIVRLPQIKWHEYSDREWRLTCAVMELVCGFIEEEKALEKVEWYGEYGHKYGDHGFNMTYPEMKGRYVMDIIKEIRDWWRTDRLFLLKQKTMLEEILVQAFFPERLFDENGKMTTIKNYGPKTVEELKKKSGMSNFSILYSLTNADDTKLLDAKFIENLCDELEKKIFDNDQKYMHLAIDISPSLWT